jgi:membrane protease YdiL (CAAX protease family)
VIGVSAWLVARGSVAGPPRVVGREPISLLLALTLLGIGMWMMIPAIYVTAIGLPLESADPPTLPEPATVPTTEPAGDLSTAPSKRVELSAHRQVMLSVISGTIVCAVLIVGNRVVRPGALHHAGFSFRTLRRGVVVGLLSALLVLPLTFMAVVLTEQLWNWVRLEHPGIHEMLKILSEADDPGLRVMICISAILVAPLFEELLFRGHVQTLIVTALAARFTWASAGARWAAIVITSVLFALVHGELWMMPPIFFLSLCLGYLYERTANLWAPIVVHLAFNAFNVGVFLFAR